MTETETETFTACPECGSSDISPRASSVTDCRRRSDKEWYCLDCKSDFDDWVEREKKYNTHPSHHIKDLVGAAVEDEEGGE